MNKLIVLAMITLVALAMFSGNAMAGGGDENYNGEDGEQPAPGINPGPGEPSEAPETGDRTRNKDA